MKKEKDNSNKALIGFILMIIILVYAVTMTILFMTTYNKLSESNCDEIKQVLYYESLELESVDDVENIYDYYSLASEYYDISDYQNTIYYCEESRELSSKYSQKLREVKAEYPEELSEILELRKEMIETEIEYTFALYESCEYIESAARSYQQGDYYMGGSNIDGQNRAINRHDSLLEDYYNLEAKYNKLKKGMLV